MPQITSVYSVAAATLTITWTQGSYLVGDVSACVFQNWLVELALVQDGTMQSYVEAVACSSLPQSARECEQPNLVGHGVYFARITATCTQSSLNSLPAPVFYSVKTRPIPAAPPIRINCSEFIPLDENGTADPGRIDPKVHEARWVPGASNNCEFLFWEVEMMYEARDMGPNDEFPEGTDWFPICGDTAYNRTTTSCSFPVRTNREYRLRIREHCVDPYADTDWTYTGQVCHSSGVRAQPPLDLTVSEVGLASFQLNWEAGSTDQDSCVFQEWSVEAKPVDVEWPGAYYNISHERDDITTVERQVVLDENGTLGTVEETVVTKVRWTTVEWRDDPHSSYRYYAIVPYPEDRQYAVYDTTTQRPPPKMNISAPSSNDSNDTTSTTTTTAPTTTRTVTQRVWLNRTVDEMRPFSDYENVTNIVYGCSGSHRNTTSCLIYVQNLPAVRYDVRVREVCLDNTLNSVWAYLADDLRPVTTMPEVVKVKTVQDTFLGFREAEAAEGAVR
jgi:hypothetical protein